jgi:20S proteasome alpha/beta subunit
MTVCIAALAENGKKAILVADKLVTTKGLLPYQTDMAADKIIEINENSSVMFCGGISDASIIIQRTLKNLDQNKWIEDIAKLVNDKHLEYLLEILTRQHLSTRGIKDINEFYKEYTQKLDEATKNAIDNALTTHYLNSGVQFLVIGKDSEGNYQIYYLGNNPRTIPQLVTSYNSTIGSGAGYANFSLIQSRYDKSLTEKEVTDMITKAKNEAEKDRDVGDKEDVVVLD